MLCLLLPIAVGFVFACRGQRQKTTTEFLFADKNSRSWILALSLVASYFSSVLLLASVAQVFSFGLQYIILALFAYWFVAAVAHVIFIPMFHRLKVTSVNEVSAWLCNINSKFVWRLENFLARFRCRLARPRKVTCMTWDKTGSDISQRKKKRYLSHP